MRRSAAGILALALAACAVGPDYQRPEAAVSAAYKEAVGWKAAEPRDEASRGNWWEIFGDPKLFALIESIDISNQNVLLAEARFRQAQALAAQSRAALFPTLDANASITRSRSPTGPSVDNRSVALNSFWELDLWGRLRRALESSAANSEASAADLAAARLSAQAELASDYFQLRVLDAQKQLLGDTVTAFDKSLELTRNRYAAGVAAKVDVAQAETLLKSTLAQSIDTGVQRAQLEHAIAILVGKPPSELSIAPVPLPGTMPRVPPRLPGGRGHPRRAAHPRRGSESAGRGRARSARVRGADDQPVQGGHRELHQRGDGADHPAQQRAHRGRHSRPAPRRGRDPGEGAGRRVGRRGACAEVAGWLITSCGCSRSQGDGRSPFKVVRENAGTSRCRKAFMTYSLTLLVEGAR